MLVPLSFAPHKTNLCLSTFSSWAWFYPSAMYQFFNYKFLWNTDEYLILDVRYNNA